MKRWMQSPVLVAISGLIVFPLVGYVLYQWVATGTLLMGKGQWGTYDQNPVRFVFSGFAWVVMALFCVGLLAEEVRNLFGLRGVFPLKPMWRSFRGKAPKPKD